MYTEDLTTLNKTETTDCLAFLRGGQKKKGLLVSEIYFFLSLVLLPAEVEVYQD